MKIRKNQSEKLLKIMLKITNDQIEKIYSLAKGLFQNGDLIKEAKSNEE